ncbi:hypothetical protein [Micromonospora sp. RTP1Z1]|uniref:hypothetical protein n=1 Tax=Micromonospora sp. RTP1Z1 TaxID=2994043 RepID=UPI0029C731A9|nr:hypothetical protein [Micromonospora sp. RTP1Z1]
MAVAAGQADGEGDAARRPRSTRTRRLADGLTETWQHHLSAGLPPADAARAAIAEFGSVDQITDAFVVQALVGGPLGCTLLAVVAALITAATSRRSYRRARVGENAGLGLVALDVAMVAAVLLVTPTLVWPMLVAVPVSLARIGLTLRSLPRARAH